MFSFVLEKPDKLFGGHFFSINSCIEIKFKYHKSDGILCMNFPTSAVFEMRMHPNPLCRVSVRINLCPKEMLKAPLTDIVQDFVPPIVCITY